MKFARAEACLCQYAECLALFALHHGIGTRKIRRFPSGATFAKSILNVEKMSDKVSPCNAGSTSQTCIERRGVRKTRNFLPPLASYKNFYIVDSFLSLDIFKAIIQFLFFIFSFFLEREREREDAYCLNREH